MIQGQSSYGLIRFPIEDFGDKVNTCMQFEIKGLRFIPYQFNILHTFDSMAFAYCGNRIHLRI